MFKLFKKKESYMTMDMVFKKEHLTLPLRVEAYFRMPPELQINGQEFVPACSGILHPDAFLHDDGKKSGGNLFDKDTILKYEYKDNTLSIYIKNPMEK